MNVSDWGLIMVESSYTCFSCDELLPGTRADSLINNEYCLRFFTLLVLISYYMISRIKGNPKFKKKKMTIEHFYIEKNCFAEKY